MQPADNSLENTYEGSSTDLSSSMSEEGKGLPQDGRSSLFRYNRVAFTVSSIALICILLIGVGGLLLARSHIDQVADNVMATNYSVGNLLLGGVGTGGNLQVGGADYLEINGLLRVSDTLVLKPGDIPANPTAGQIYYDKTTRAPYYYNGDRFVSLVPSVLSQYVSDIGGASGAIGLGNGLQITGGQLGLTNAVTQALVSTGGGVRSLQGQTGDVVLAGGSGIGINGTTISNNGVVGLNGTANQINVSATTGTITLSLPQSIAVTSTPTFAGGTLNGALNVTTGDVTIGAAGTTAGNLRLANSTNNNLSRLQAAAPTGAGTASFILPSIAGGTTDTICLLTLGNCAGGGGITGSGTAGNLAKFSGANTITDSGLSESGATLTYAGTLTLSALTAGVLHTNGSGVVSTSPVLLGTETTGNYIASLGSLTGLTLGGTNGTPGAIPTLAVAYGSSANTAVQGNIAVTCPSGTGNLTGGGNGITLGTGGSCNNLTIVNSPTFSGTVAVQGAGGITVGIAGSTAGILNLANTTNTNLTALRAVAPTGVGAATIQLPSIAGGSTDTVCLVALGNCAGSGGGITGSGTTGTIAQFSGTGSITDSPLISAGGNVTASGNFIVQGAGGLTVGNPGSVVGNLNLANATSARTVVLQGLNPTGVGNATIQLPSVAGGSTDTVCLFTLANCVGAGGGVTTTAGTQNFITKYNNAGATQITNSQIYDNGTNVNIGNTLGTGGLFNVGATNQFQVSSAGAVTAVGVNAGAGLLQGALGLTISGAAVNLNNNSNFATNINTGNSTGAVTIGNSAAGAITLQSSSTINLTAGAASTITTGANTLTVTSGNFNVTSGGLINGQTISSSANFTGTLTTAGNTTISNLTGSGTRAVCADGSNILVSCGTNANGVTLQQAYDADTNSADAVITLTSTDGNLIFRNPSSGGITSGAILKVDQLATGAVEGLRVESAGTSNLLTIRDTTATAVDVFTIADGGAVTLRNQTNSGAAFQIQGSSGTNLLTVDTSSNNTLAVSLGLTTATATIDDGGSLRVRGASVADYVTPLGSTLSGNSAVIDNQSYANGAAALAMGLTSTSGISARGIAVADARSIAHQPSIGVLSPDEGLIGGFTWDGSTTVFSVKTNDKLNGAGSSGDISLESGDSTTGFGTGAVLIDSGTPGGGGAAGNISIGTGAYAHNTTIGNVTGASTLNLQSGSSGINLLPSGSSNTGVIVKPGVDSTAAFEIQDAGTASLFKVDSTTGNVGIANAAPGFLLHVGDSAVTSGTSVARFENAGGTCTITPNTAGGITCTSDRRLKKDITATSNQSILDRVLGINVVNYRLLAEGATDLAHTGVIAQEFINNFPDLVQQDAAGYYSVSYAGLTPYLAGAIQAQQQQIVSLQQQVNNPELASLNVSGKATIQNLLVKGAATLGALTVTDEAEFKGSITINGHIITAGDTPVGQILGAAGMGATIAVEGNDTAGTITITAGSTAQTAGDVASVTFHKAFSKRPVINLTPNSGPAAAAEYYYESTTGGFKIMFADSPAPGTVYRFSYTCFE